MLTAWEMLGRAHTIVYNKLRTILAYETRAINSYFLLVHKDNWELNIKREANGVVAGLVDSSLSNLLNTFYKYCFWDKQTVSNLCT